MDIAGLSKLTGDTIVLIIGVLGFLVRVTRHPNVYNEIKILHRPSVSPPRNTKSHLIGLVYTFLSNISIIPSK